MTPFDPDEAPVDVMPVGHVTLSTPDAARAVRFYRRVFGFRALGGPGRDGAPMVLLHGRGGICLAIRERRAVPAVPRRLLFEAMDLDEARERLWDLGVALADGHLGPRIDPERRCRSLRVRDPDGNEIELVEAAPAFASRSARGEAVIALKR